MENTTAHKFELAGLGRPPYRFIGHTEHKFQACHGAPVQAGTSCDYCGTGIVDAYNFTSADGRRFKVGSDCVAKAGDRGMVDLIKRAAAKIATERRHAREAEQIASIAARLRNEAVRDALHAQPHPESLVYSYLRNHTLLDWAEHMMAHGGNSGKLRVGREIKRLGLDR